MRNTFFTLLFIVSALFPAAASAGFRSWWSGASYKGNKNDIETLIITGNYTKPRFLADSVMNETRQPYILIPCTGQDKIFFCPADGSEMELRESDLAKFINFIHPRQIIILGTKEYIPAKYFSGISAGSKICMMGNDWANNAASIQKFMGTSNLCSEYKKRFPEYSKGVPMEKKSASSPKTQQKSTSKKMAEPDFLPPDLNSETETSIRTSDAPVLIQDNSVQIRKKR